MVVRSGPKRNVRILLVGDRGVGKTSLILSLVSEEFPEDVPPKAEEITIPADVTPEQVPTNIVDYSSAEQSDESLIEEIQKASVICIIYAVDDDETLERVTSYWLPLIREQHSAHSRPVVIVGNKIDLVDYSTMNAVFGIMEEYPEVESCLECSAKTLKNISEMFYYAQKAVLHPTAPLYSCEKEMLTEACKKALVRIFKVSDMDGDGLLNDIELNNFQRRCFNTPLQPQVIEDVKIVLRKNVEDGLCGDAVTLKGFIFLHSLFIQRGRNETTWAVLRKFGYDDNLALSRDYLQPHVRLPHGGSVELSTKGQRFLAALFARYDRDRDLVLAPVELEELFSPAPSAPWKTPELPATVATDPRGWLTLRGYMCRWALMVSVELPRAMEYLAHLGYNVYEADSQLSAIQILAPGASRRSVFRCHVIGAAGCGKSELCKSLIKPASPSPLPKPASVYSGYAADSVQVYGQEKILILRDIDLNRLSDPLTPSEVLCDVACLVYDVSDPKSFEYVARIYIKYFAESKIPVLIVANKSDLEEAHQEYLLQPSAFCTKYKILPPQPFTSKGHVRKDVYVKLATMAAFPQLRQFGLIPETRAMWIKAGIGIALATAIGFIVARLFKSR